MRRVILQSATDPKKAIAKDHSTALDQFTTKGGDPSFSGSSRDKAGKIPTNPAARGIYEVLGYCPLKRDAEGSLFQ